MEHNLGAKMTSMAAENDATTSDYTHQRQATLSLPNEILFMTLEDLSSSNGLTKEMRKVSKVFDAKVTELMFRHTTLSSTCITKKHQEKQHGRPKPTRPGKFFRRITWEKLIGWDSDWFPDYLFDPIPTFTIFEPYMLCQIGRSSKLYLHFEAGLRLASKIMSTARVVTVDPEFSPYLSKLDFNKFSKLEIVRFVMLMSHEM